MPANPETLDDLADPDHLDLPDSPAARHQSARNPPSHHAENAHPESPETLDLLESLDPLDVPATLAAAETMDHQDLPDPTDHPDPTETQAAMDHPVSLAVPLRASPSSLETPDHLESLDHLDFPETTDPQDETVNLAALDPEDHPDLLAHLDPTANPVDPALEDHPVCKASVVSAPNTAPWMAVSSSRMVLAGSKQQLSRVRINIIPSPPSTVLLLFVLVSKSTI